MYKVLRRENGNLVSCVMPKVKELHSWIITYLPDKWIKAKVGKIFVCKYLKDAIEIKYAECAHEIWRCQTRKTSPLETIGSMEDQFFNLFWGIGKMDESLVLYSTMSAPRGTYVADKIKLTKKVWPK